MENEGYIKLYRKMTKWGWYEDSATKDVFLHLLLIAQYEPCEYRGVHLDIGQAVTSIKKLSADTGLSVRSVRTALDHLKATQEVTQCQHGKISVITLNNYGEYQGSDTKNDKMATRCRHDTDTIPTRPNSLRSQEVKNKEKDTPKGVSKKKVAEKATYGEFGNVKLTGEEHEKLVDSLGDKGAEDYIERLSAYLAQSGKPYKNHYATILNWWRKDGQPVNRSPAPMPAMLPDKGRDISGLTPRQIFGGG